MRISDWSSDVCSSDLPAVAAPRRTGLLRSTAVFSAMTLLSRIAGFVRDMLQATLFGTGGAMRAFIVAYRIPNFLRRVFDEGSMSMAFVPVLNQNRQQEESRVRKECVIKCRYRWMPFH